MRRRLMGRGGFPPSKDGSKNRLATRPRGSALLFEGSATAAPAAPSPPLARCQALAPDSPASRAPQRLRLLRPLLRSPDARRSLRIHPHLSSAARLDASFPCIPAC